jgi:hypothetical protein
MAKFKLSVQFCSTWPKPYLPTPSPEPHYTPDNSEVEQKKSWNETKIFVGNPKDHMKLLASMQ